MKLKNKAVSMLGGQFLFILEMKAIATNWIFRENRKWTAYDKSRTMLLTPPLFSLLG